MEKYTIQRARMYIAIAMSTAMELVLSTAKVNSKEDLLEHPYVILINIHEYEIQQQNQPRKIFFRDSLMNKCVNECMNEYLLYKTFILTSLFHTQHNKASQTSRNISTYANMCFL